MEIDSPALMDEGPPSAGLARAAAGGVLWESLSFIAGKLLTLVATIVLARLLTPEDFGVVTLALVFITYAEVITDLGVARALVYLPGHPGRTDAALSLALLWSSALVVAAMLTAPAVAGFFGRPEISPMIRVLSVSLLLGGIGEIPDSLLRKGLRFRRRLIVSFSRSLARGVVSVALALAGFGAWAIVAGHVVSYVVWNAVAWPLSGARPTRRFWRLSRSSVRPLVAYGIPVAANSLLLTLVFNVDYLIIGRGLGPEALGLYTLAFRVPELMIIQALWVFGAVTFPMYSLLKHDRKRLQRGYLTSARVQSAFGMAVGAGLAVIAPMLVPLLFGDRWIGSVVPLQALALYAAFRALGTGITELSNGIGRPGVNVALSLVFLAMLAPTLWLSTRYGINVVSWAHAAVALMMAFLKQGVAFRLLRLPLRRLAEILVPTLGVGLGTAAGAGAVRLWLDGPDWLRLLAAIVAGGAAGLGALWLSDRRFLAELRAVVRRPSALKA